MTPPSDLRRIALLTMVAAIIALASMLAFGNRSSNGQSNAARPAAVATPTPFPTSTPTPNPFTVSSTDDRVTITRLWSPAANLARAEGSASSDQVVVDLTVDGVARPEVTIRSTNGSFELDIHDLAPGPQEICLSDACQRVLVSEPGEDRVTIEARIDQAALAADARFPFRRLLPDWVITVGGPNSSAGGSADAATQTITIYANSGRSLDEYEITVLHEVGHAVDTEYMTELGRQQFRELRNHSPDLVWGPADELAVGEDRWRNSAEDFAEVFVAWVLNNNYQIMSDVVSPQPTQDELKQFCLLIGIDDIACE